jgi:N-acetylglucosamine transport system permease protein
MRHGRYPFVLSFLAAPIALYAVFVLAPIVQAFFVAMTDWNGLDPNYNFVGLDNFKKILADSQFLDAVLHHIVLLVVLPIITIAIALFFAFMLNTGGGTRGGTPVGVWGSKFYRVVFFLPQVLAVVIVGVIFLRVFAPDESGIANGFLGWFGISPISFMADYGLLSILITLIWQAVGFYVVLFSASMASIPGEVYEAATLDGANRFSLFFRITIPMVWDTIQVAWVYLGILAFDAFALVMVMSIEEGGPDGATTVLPVLIYKHGIRESSYGYASALGVALFILTITFAALSLRTSRRETIEL